MRIDYGHACLSPHRHSLCPSLKLAKWQGLRLSGEYSSFLGEPLLYTSRFPAGYVGCQEEIQNKQRSGNQNERAQKQLTEKGAFEDGHGSDLANEGATGSTFNSGCSVRLAF
jgi:hypothetical protein